MKNSPPTPSSTSINTTIVLVNDQNQTPARNKIPLESLSVQCSPFPHLMNKDILQSPLASPALLFSHPQRIFFQSRSGILSPSSTNKSSQSIMHDDDIEYLDNNQEVDSSSSITTSQKAENNSMEKKTDDLFHLILIFTRLQLQINRCNSQLSKAFYQWKHLLHIQTITFQYKTRIIQEKQNVRILSKWFYCYFSYPIQSNRITHAHTFFLQMKHYYLWKSQYYYLQYHEIQRQYQSFYQQYRFFLILMKYNHITTNKKQREEAEKEKERIQKEVASCWYSWKSITFPTTTLQWLKRSHCISKLRYKHASQIKDKQYAFHHWKTHYWMASKLIQMHQVETQELQESLHHHKLQLRYLIACAHLVHRSDAQTILIQYRLINHCFQTWQKYKETKKLKQWKRTKQFEVGIKQLIHVFQHHTNYHTLQRFFHRWSCHTIRFIIHHQFVSSLAQQQELFAFTQTQMTQFVAMKQQHFVGSLELQQFQIDKLSVTQNTLEQQVIQLQNHLHHTNQQTKERYQMYTEDSCSHYERKIIQYEKQLARQEEHLAYQTDILVSVKATIQKQVQHIENQKQRIHALEDMKMLQQKETLRLQTLTKLQSIWSFIRKHYLQEMQTVFLKWKYIIFTILPIQKQQRDISNTYQRNLQQMSILKMSYQKEILQYQYQIKDLSNQQRKYTKFVQWWSRYFTKYELVQNYQIYHKVWEQWCSCIRFMKHKEEEEELLLLQKVSLIDQAVGKDEDEDDDFNFAKQSVVTQTEQLSLQDTGTNPNTPSMQTKDTACGNEISYETEVQQQRQQHKQEFQDLVELMKAKETQNFEKRLKYCQFVMRSWMVLETNLLVKDHRILLSAFYNWNNYSHKLSNLTSVATSELSVKNSSSNLIVDKIEPTITPNLSHSEQHMVICQTVVDRKLQRMSGLIDLWWQRLLMHYLLLYWHDVTFPLNDDEDDVKESDC